MRRRRAVQVAPTARQDASTASSVAAMPVRTSPAANGTTSRSAPPRRFLSDAMAALFDRIGPSTAPDLSPRVQPPPPEAQRGPGESREVAVSTALVHILRSALLLRTKPAAQAKIGTIKVEA